MGTYQHYAWACGQFVLLGSALCSLSSALLFGTTGIHWYRLSYVGAILSYAIVCHKSLGVPQPNSAYFRRAAADENVQYFLLALFWLLSKPIRISVIPYAIFALFHVLTFLRSSILQTFLSSQTSTQGQPAQTVPHPILKSLQVWVKANYDAAMRVVAYTELGILGRVFLGALMFQNSFLTPVIYAHFLRARYYQSQYTRRAVHHAFSLVDSYVRRPGQRVVFVRIWDTLQNAVVNWGGSSYIHPRPSAT